MNSSALQLASSLISGKLLLLIAAGQLAQVAAGWLASWLLARSDATLGNAVRWYVYGLLASLVTTVVFIGLLFVAALLGAAGVILLFGLWLAALVYFAFIIPMRLYDVRLGRAFAMIVVTWVAATAASYGLSAAIGQPFSRARLQQAIATVPHPTLPALPGVPSLPSVAPAARSTAAAKPASAKKMVTLTRPVRIPVKLDGVTKGDVELEKGRMLEVLGVEGNRVRIKYLDWTATIPRDATDL